MAKLPARNKSPRKSSWSLLEDNSDFEGLALDLPPSRLPGSEPSLQGRLPSALRNSTSVLTVGELSAKIRGTLEGTFDRVTVTGEVTGMRPAGSGHVYFALKDSQAFINCVLWSRDAARHPVLPRDGEEAEVDGRLGVYEPRGQYQLVVSAIRPAGLGKLHMEFLRLKERLDKAGLFDPEHKRPIPRTPVTIGIVTSPTGAALRDILAVLQRRAPGIRVVIWPARVQGETAAREVAEGVEFLGKLGMAEVLIVGRGGGSMEDLWAFNDESLAHVIARCPIPVISAVGHEVDFTIADFVADLRAPTPSAAAEVVSQSSAELARELAHLRARLDRALQLRMEPMRQLSRLQSRLGPALGNRLRLLRQRLDHLMLRPVMARPTDRIETYRQRMDENLYRGLKGLERIQERTVHRYQRSSGSLISLGQAVIERYRHRLKETVSRMESLIQRRVELLKSRQESAAHQLRALDHRHVLARGYAVVFQSSGSVVRKASEVTDGETLEVEVYDGKFSVHVGSPNPNRGETLVLPTRRPRATRKPAQSESDSPTRNQDLFTDMEGFQEPQKE